MTPLERAKHDLGKTRTELSRAEMQVRQLETRIGKIEAYIEMAALYEAGDTAAEAAARVRNGVAVSAVRATVELLTERKTRMQTREILRALQDKGIVIGGSNPANNLSGFLSRAPELGNNRLEGWGLADWVDGEEPSTEVAEAPPSPAAPKPREVYEEPAVAPQTRAQPQWEPAADLDDEIPF